MDRVKKAIENHKKGYNCAQAVLCAFSDKTNLSEDELFRISEAFGGGMGGSGGVCGAVSGMVALAGIIKSKGIDYLPETAKKDSYAFAKEMMDAFEKKNTTIICSKLKDGPIRTCDGCIEDAVRILEEKIG